MLDKRTITLYFDFLSPYSYFLFNKIRSQSAFTRFQFDFKPVLMGKLFTEHGFPGPGDIPAKRKYELKKCFRIAKKEDFDFNPPPSFPFNPMGIIRLATFHAAREKQVDVIKTIFDAVWANGHILEDPDQILNVLKQANIPEEIFNRSFEREAKKELKDNIKEAISFDIFGVPSYRSDEKEYFWGLDSLDDFIRYLDNEDDYNKELYQKLI